jgi:hypothetical protein
LSALNTTQRKKEVGRERKKKGREGKVKRKGRVTSIVRHCQTGFPT